MKNRPSTERKDEFERRVVFRPAFDKRSSDPSKNYGIHGVDLAFYLIGPKGAMQFVLYTNWQLPHVQAEFDAKPPHGQFPYMFHSPLPSDVGYHSYKPMYEGQTPMKDCHLLGCDCYYDGSSLQAEDVFKILTEKGDEGVWAELERRYHSMFTEELAA